MDKIDFLYYINLENRLDRNASFLKECARVSIPENKIIRFNAIYGHEHEFTDEEKRLLDTSEYWSGYHHKLGPLPLWNNKRFIYSCAGNQLSHYYVMKDAYERGLQWIIVSQDDVVFLKDVLLFHETLNNIIDNWPHNAEMVNIAMTDDFHNLNIDDDEEDYRFTYYNVLYNEHICWLAHNPYSTMYILNNIGIKNMYEYYNTNGFYCVTDGDFNRYCTSRNIWYGARKMLGTINSNFGSDTRDYTYDETKI